MLRSTLASSGMRWRHIWRSRRTYLDRQHAALSAPWRPVYAPSGSSEPPVSVAAGIRPIAWPMPVGWSEAYACAIGQRTRRRRWLSSAEDQTLAAQLREGAYEAKGLCHPRARSCGGPRGTAELAPGATRTPTPLRRRSASQPPPRNPSFPS